MSEVVCLHRCSKLLVDNYVSLTRRDYVGYVGPDGRDTFPAKVHSGWSGYAHNVPKTVPTTAQVGCMHAVPSVNLSWRVLPWLGAWRPC